MEQKNKKLKILFLDIFTDNEKFRKEIEEKVYKGRTLSEHIRSVFGLDKNEWLKVDAIVIGGSAKDPVKGQERGWMRKTYKFIRQAVRKNIPILGICGGL